MTANQKNAWNAKADALLEHCRDVWRDAAGLDTAVRDSIAHGLASLVHAAFDCRAIAIEFRDTESWIAFIRSSTAQWFRDRGFVEWFCAGAATLFMTSPPRCLSDLIVVRKKPRRRA